MMIPIRYAMPVTIKRYRNRKLYNTQSKRYITLEQIEELVKAQQEVKVIDNFSGEDITAATLSQIIFEQEKNRAGFLPVSLLFSLVRSGGYRIDEIRRNIFEALNLAHHYDVEIERRVNQLVSNGELGQAEGAQLLRKMLEVSSPQQDAIESLEGKIAEFFNQRQVPTKNDLQALVHRIDRLTKRVGELKETNQTG